MKPNSNYSALTGTRPPAPLMVEALKYVKEKNRAIDIGGGSLRDAKNLLQNGFEVTVVDQDPEIQGIAKQINSEKLHDAVSTFEDYAFPADTFDLAVAIYSLPFNPPATFDRVFSDMKRSLKTQGIFCGQLFGVNDSWNTPPTKMTFHSKPQVLGLLEGLEIIFISEEEKNEHTAHGILKHWHAFHIIARKS